MAVCYNCGAPLPEKKSIFRSTSCQKCGRDVKVCRNCAFYSPGAQHDCREHISEPVRDKERANFCEYFTPADNAAAHSGSEAQSRSRQKEEEARKRFRDLFGD